MAWYEKAVFYHIYPLGLTGAPATNSYGEPVPRLNDLIPWIDHMKRIGCTGLYIGPLFESASHGYDTTDYRRLDSRLGTNEDLKRFVALCHEAGIRVILDGVVNHIGRDFFAFKDIQAHRENSRYTGWYCNVNFYGNNEYNDGFSYDNWGGYNLLVKLNLRNPEVRDYLLDAIRFWVSEFDIDGLRLDTADVLDFDFMRQLRCLANEVKPEFWLMGEVIHGDYARWANENTLNSVTNYHLHKALFSGHNDHNYFEIAHTVKRQMDMGLAGGRMLYSFVDNHDVDRIMSKLNNKAHFLPVHVLLYALPGVPSIYYGSEFGIEGRKDRGSDAPLRPCLDLGALESGQNGCLELITALGRVYNSQSALWYGDYRELQLTTQKFAFARGDLVVTVNNGDGPADFDLGVDGAFTGALTGRQIASENGRLRFEIGGNSGEIWIPQGGDAMRYEPVRQAVIELPKQQPAPAASTPASPAQEAPAPKPDIPAAPPANKPYEQMTVEELQSAVLAKLAANGPLTDRMRREVAENVYRDSLLNWVKSFR